MTTTPELMGWDMMLGFTVANLDAVMAEQARRFLGGGDGDVIPVRAADPGGELTCALGMPRLTVTLHELRLTLTLAEVVLDGRPIAPGGLRLTVRLDLALEAPSWDQMLADPVVDDDLKDSLGAMLRRGTLSRERHSLAVLRPQFAALDLVAARCADMTELGALGADEPRVVALLQVWLRQLATRNPFLLGCVILTRPGGPPSDAVEPTLASWGCLRSVWRGATDSQVVILLATDHRPAPPGHRPGATAMAGLSWGGSESPQGMLALLPGLLLERQLAPALRAALQLDPQLRRSRRYDKVHKINPAGAEYIECLRISEKVSVTFRSANGVDPELGRFGAVVAMVHFQRDALARKFDSHNRDLDKTVFTDRDFDPRYPMAGWLFATLTWRFTIVERKLRVDQRLETVAQISPETRDAFATWIARDPAGGQAVITRLFTRELNSYEPALAQLHSLRLDRVMERCIVPGGNQYSFRDPHAAKFTTFSDPFALYFALTRTA